MAAPAPVPPAEGRLAIVCPTFNQVSETFVADHVRSLAPGRTVLICRDGRGAERFGCPVLSHVNPDYTHFDRAGQLRNAALPRLRRFFGWGPNLALSDRMRLIEFLRLQEVSVVLAEFGYSGAMVAEVCHRLGLPLFVYFRGHDATSHRRFAPLRRRYQRMFRTAQGFIAESRFLADEVRSIGCPEARLHVVTSGMDPAQFGPGEPEPGRIVAIGRLVEMKAPHLTIEAFARIAGRFPQARLDLVGDGLLRGRCEAAIAAHGLEGRVTMHGYLSHDGVAALMRRASMFVQHSVTDPVGNIEGFPVAIAEAMATALPVVSTRHSGIPEHVADGVTGWLVAEHDVAGMAEAMARLMEDPERARAMGRAGRTYALEHLTRARNHVRLREILGLGAAAPAAGAEALPAAGPAAGPAAAGPAIRGRVSA
jgi:colanic acid/amylovoran biosynthesis glycosyltransferase